MTQPTPCRVAIVGAGRMARAHAEAFRDVPGVSLTGIHSRTRARAEALAGEVGIERVSDSVEALAEVADLLVVTVTETAMLAITRAALATGAPWSLLLEKPPGLTPTETRSIEAAAREAGRPVWVGLNRQWMGATQNVLEELKAFDGPRTIVVEDAQDLATAKALDYSEAIQSHWMYANSIHLVDYFRYLGRGDVVEVTPLVEWTPEAPNHPIAGLRFASGDVGLYRCCWDAPGPWAVSVYAPGHRWELRPLERAITQRPDERPGREMPAHPWDKQFKPGFRLQAAHAVAGAMGAPCPLPTIADALQSMTLVQRIYPSPAEV